GQQDGGGQGRRDGAGGGSGPAANSLRPQRASNGQGGARMLRRGVPANTTGGVSGIKEEGGTRPRTAGQRILVVEDNRDAADSLCLLLAMYGYDVAVAYTGHDGGQAAG